MTPPNIATCYLILANDHVTSRSIHRLACFWSIICILIMLIFSWCAATGTDQMLQLYDNGRRSIVERCSGCELAQMAGKRSICAENRSVQRSILGQSLLSHYHHTLCFRKWLLSARSCSSVGRPVSRMRRWRMHENVVQRKEWSVVEWRIGSNKMEVLIAGNSQVWRSCIPNAVDQIRSDCTRISSSEGGWSSDLSACQRVIRTQPCSFQAIWKFAHATAIFATALTGAPSVCSPSSSPSLSPRCSPNIELLPFVRPAERWRLMLMMMMMIFAIPSSPLSRTLWSAETAYLRITVTFALAHHSYRVFAKWFFDDAIYSVRTQ